MLWRRVLYPRIVLCTRLPPSGWAWRDTCYLLQRTNVGLLELPKASRALGIYGPLGDAAANFPMGQEFESFKSLLQTGQKLWCNFISRGSHGIEVRLELKFHFIGMTDSVLLLLSPSLFFPSQPFLNKPHIHESSSKSQFLDNPTQDNHRRNKEKQSHLKLL